MANAHHIRPVPSSNEEVNLEIDDTATVRALSEEGHQPPILVLSRDAGLVETVRKAGPRGTNVLHSPDLDHVADKLPTMKPGVLVVDTASTADVASMVAQLTQHFPELVVVVAGKKEDSSALMQLTAAGRIFRFLLTPLSHGQTRLALEAAMAQHLDLKATDERRSSGSDSTGGNKNYVVTYGALAAGLVIVIGGIWFGVKQFTGEPATPPVAQPTATPGAQPGGLPDRPDPVQAELALAKEAFDNGKLLEPAGENALDLYRSALSLDPNSEDAKAGIRSVTDKILERAEAALTAERLEEAVRSIEIARDIDATHPRLSFLDTQIARERERMKLSQAQEVGNRVRQLVNQATDRMQNGRWITPAGTSARDALVEARRLDPTEPTVQQAIRDLSGLLTEEARKSLGAGKVDEAQSYASAARSLGSAGAALATVERAIADANKAPAATPAAAAATRRPAQPATSGPNIESLLAEAKQRISEGKLIDPTGSSAKDSVMALQAAAPTSAAVDDVTRSLTNRLLDISKQATNAKAYDRAGQFIAAAREIGIRYNEAGISQAERDLTAAREASQQASVVSAASLKRVKIVNPQYPEAARKKGIEGWVELAFTVMPNGSVDNVEVRNASPADVFDDSAIRAVRQWRFEPVVRNGEKIQQRAMVRLKFENKD